MNAAKKTIIFVDGNCIVCDYEVAQYKRMKPEAFDLVDIRDKKFDAAKYGLTPEAVEHSLHVLTPEGEIKIGIDAFVHIWERLDRFKLGSALLQSSAFNPVARAGYRIFASYIRPLLPKRNRDSR